MFTIKVLGPGCANCQKVGVVTKKAVNEMGVEAEMIKVTDYAEIMEYPIISTPGLVINEKTVSSGRIPSTAEITSFVTSALATS
jgi:small redox-active disulfide protein 2